MLLQAEDPATDPNDARAVRVDLVLALPPESLEALLRDPDGLAEPLPNPQGILSAL